jgi:transketolase
MRKQFVSTFESLIKKDSKLSLLLCDIGVFGFRNSIAKYPNRVMNIGILEQSTIGVAAGMSRSGLIPVIHTIAPFLVERAFEQIKIDFGYQDIGCNLVSVGASYDYASLGCTHHCPADVALLKNIPGMEILTPGHPSEFDSLFRQIYNNGKPSYFRLSEKSNTKSNEVKFGKANLIKNGNKVTIIAIGPVLDIVLKAAEGEDVDILYYSTIIPFDSKALQKSMEKKSKIMVIEPFYSGTMSNLIIESLEQKSIIIKSIGVPREFLRNYGSVEQHDNVIGFTSKNISKELKKLINA